jgi:hypothetical protein
VKKRHLIALTAVVLLFGQSLGLGSASALTTTYTGTIDSTDPEMEVVTISPPNCGTQASTLVHYEVIEIPDPIGGPHVFSMTSTDGFASLYLYEGSFDPENGAENCVAGDNGADPVGFEYELLDGTPYFVVVFDDQFAQTGGSYELVIDSPDPPPTVPTTEEPPVTEPTTPPTSEDVAPATAAPAGATRPRFTG